MRTTSYAIALTMVTAATITAFAHGGATGIVKERMDLMKDISAQVETIGKMIKGEISFDSDRAASAANMIAEHSRGILDKFPEGSTEHPSEALPAIWDNWEEFARLTEELESTAGALAEAAGKAENAAGIRPQFATLGETCSACHEDFRKED